MNTEITLTSPLRTKLHRPPLPGDYVHRPRLLTALDQRRERPLTIVSAPAGYGKSVLTSCWLETNDRPGAWLSLDEQDNDLRRFLSYFLAALRTIFPDAFRGALSLLNAPELPPLSVLAHELANELDGLDRHFILVLDDIHCIEEESIYELLAALLRHPPRCMHMVLVGRRNPNLPLSALRGLGMVTEIRIQDLRFTVPETTEYLRQVLGEKLDEATATALARKSEGWVTGLHLAVLAMRSFDHPDHSLLELKGTTRYVTDYLVSEVLSRQPPSIRHYVLNTSILNRFNTRLCDLLGSPGPDEGAATVNGEEFIRKIQESGLFVIPLDPENRWFRYHHLFQQLLHDQLLRSRAEGEVAALHYRAGVWFEENGFFAEALHHFLTGRFPEDAGRMVARHGHALIDQERVVELEGWLRELPRDVVVRNPMLLVFEAWIARFKRHISKMTETLDRVEALLQKDPPPREVLDLVSGCMYAMRSYESYCMLDPGRARAMAEQAIARVPGGYPYMRGFAMIIQAATMQMIGRYADALAALNAALADEAFQQKSSQAFLLAGLSPVCMVEADFLALRRAAARLLKLGEETGLPPYRAWGRLYLACSHYQSNEVEKAERILAAHLEDRYLMYPHTAGDGATVLAFSLQILGQPERARQIADLLTSHAVETGNDGLLRVEKALQAELALRQGRLTEAMAWARTFEPRTMQAHYFFYLPELTLAKILVTENTPESRRRAQRLLSKLEKFSRSTCNHSILIPVLGLQAMLLDLEADETAALGKVGESLALAEPGGGRRFFLDLGPPMARLLRRFRRRKTAVESIGVLLVAFNNEGRRHAEPGAHRLNVSGAQTLVEPLTLRELDILELLSQRLQSKEIAERLFISSTTVKKHLQNIYQKLGAANRRQCLEIAERFGILHSR
jgi:LuxR family transcriptional regulator, maltose regulon positive regulatory protein